MKPLQLRLAGLLRPNAHRHTGGNDGIALGLDAPVGAICLYDGDVAPATWAFCDGTNATPDLRNRFIRGANHDGELGGAGGSLSLDVSHAHTDGGMTTNSVSHSHSGGDYAGLSTATAGFGGGGLTLTGPTHTHSLTFSGLDSHDHSIAGSSAVSGATVENRPPYYAARYIQRKTKSAGIGGSSAGPIAGLISRFLSHNHADDTAVNFGLPVGAIVPFRGSGWPANFALCDGGSGTPDLRDKFVVAAGDTYGRGATGGVASVDLAHSHAAGAYSGSASPNHAHAGSSSAVVFGNFFNATDSPGSSFTGANSAHSHSDLNVSVAGSHTHTVSGSTGASGGVVSSLPAYYQLCFIKRVS